MTTRVERSTSFTSAPDTRAPHFGFSNTDEFNELLKESSLGIRARQDPTLPARRPTDHPAPAREDIRKVKAKFRRAERKMGPHVAPQNCPVGCRHRDEGALTGQDSAPGAVRRPVTAR
ncbi:hypothetical protein GCM10015535_25730 [Streptomyces gelaticus]|uniref:Uncharacterized protein n=1 Tax=Streptomyces gelaticus TaxID=285446 RepID=A0ABQ2VZH5_9ACTN|nr:hypothetical protein GCM10015535_25730 [Streptomyces gelaticus]